MLSSNASLSLLSSSKSELELADTLALISIFMFLLKITGRRNLHSSFDFGRHQGFVWTSFLPSSSSFLIRQSSPSSFSIHNKQRTLEPSPILTLSTTLPIQILSKTSSHRKFSSLRLILLLSLSRSNSTLPLPSSSLLLLLPLQTSNHPNPTTSPTLSLPNLPLLLQQPSPPRRRRKKLHRRRRRRSRRSSSREDSFLVGLQQSLVSSEVDEPFACCVQEGEG